MRVQIALVPLRLFGGGQDGTRGQAADSKQTDQGHTSNNTKRMTESSAGSMTDDWIDTRITHHLGLPPATCIGKFASDALPTANR
jgi:hypothetical protein